MNSIVDNNCSIYQNRIYVIIYVSEGNTKATDIIQKLFHLKI